MSSPSSSSSSSSFSANEDKVLGIGGGGGNSDIKSLNPFKIDDMKQSTDVCLTSTTSTTTATTAPSTSTTKIITNIDNELDEEIPDALTASYSEISFHNNILINNNITDNDNTEKLLNKQRPDTLVCDKKNERQTFPYNLQGTVSVDGCNMTHFIAENFEYKIKLSSPVTRKDSSTYSTSGGSRITTPSAPMPTATTTTVAGTNFLRQFFQPSHLTQIDSNVLNDIENEAQYLAASVDTLTENLCNLLHSISSITADNVETYKNAVNKLTDCMDGNIKSMYTIMAKTEEISNAMKPTEQLATRIREIKRLVDMLEGNI